MYPSVPFHPDPYLSLIHQLNKPYNLTWYRVYFYPVPRTTALSHRMPPSAGHLVRAALLQTAIQNCVLPCDSDNTSWYVVWWLCCFTVKWNFRKAS